MKKTLAFTIALPTILGATSCTETSGDAARLEQSIDKIATAVTAIADGGDVPHESFIRDALLDKPNVRRHCRRLGQELGEWMGNRGNGIPFFF
ncbi:MAG: hypothetical protein GY747_02320 [Planctomycetes bacterium]|nr:hypothetical protein [Planctomycetota bacterium]MCP4770266.1 hypothetical protein [Planctomycetota bacterium]MCP4860586.1 hypothetical protein [Planctomycetota bacterium]